MLFIAIACIIDASIIAAKQLLSLITLQLQAIAWLSLRKTKFVFLKVMLLRSRLLQCFASLRSATQLLCTQLRCSSFILTRAAAQLIENSKKGSFAAAFLHNTTQHRSTAASCFVPSLRYDATHLRFA